ncbi:hypothetical protein M758_12G015700 [Ceratodon purpureus]|nr:hypothetical protein M758_12G015700 [Ceratodon purpureus]
MARSKVKITPLGRKIQSSRSQRSGGLKKSKAHEFNERDHDTENCPPNLDYNVIEEIANGVEKMILSWSHLDEGEPEHIKASALEDEKEQAFAMWTLPAENKVFPYDTRPRKKEGFCEESEGIASFSFSKQMQEQPEEAAVTAEIAAGITADILSLDGSCSGGGMGHAISKVVTEAMKHSGQMTADDSPAEKTLTKSAAYWYLEASNVSPAEKCTSTCTEETSCLKSCNADADSPLQSLHQKRSREPNKPSWGKDVSISEQSSNAHSTPGTPPISERSVKRMQSQEDSSNKKLQLSMSKKTRWSEKATFAPMNGACCSEDEDCLKSPRSDCSLLDLTSNSSWNDPLVGSPCRKPTPLLIDGAHVHEEFGPWDSVAGHDPPVIVSRVTARPDSDVDNCTKEKTSFVSFKLWKANKESESGHEGNGEGESSEGKPLTLDTNTAPEQCQGSTDGRERQDCGVAAQTMAAPPPTSEPQSNGERSTEEMEELQIALLECATEYEIKTIDMKMKLKNIKNMKDEALFLDPQSTASDVSDVIVAGANKPPAMTSTDQLPEDEMQQMERVKRQVYKLQHQKGCLSKELADLKKKERQFELQTKSLDAALHKLDRLEWEMVKKEQEVEDWKLRQRHAEAQLQDSAMELQRLTNLGDLQDLPMDTASLLSLLPTLRDFVQTLAPKDTGGGYSSDDQSQQDEALFDSTQVDEIVSNLMHEIQGLQHELNGMVCPEEPKQFKKIAQRQTNVTSRDQSGHKPTTKPFPRLPRDRYPYGKL